jgi:hypothetical protein
MHQREKKEQENEKEVFQLLEKHSPHSPCLRRCSTQRLGIIKHRNILESVVLRQSSFCSGMLFAKQDCMTKQSNAITVLYSLYPNTLFGKEDLLSFILSKGKKH